MDIFTVDNVLYLITNLFRIYVLFRFVKIFFDREYTSKRVELIAFTAYFLINSAAFLLFSNIFINLASNLLLFFLLTFIYKSGLSTKLISTFLIYAVNIIIEGVVYNLMIFSKVGMELEDAAEIVSVILLFLFVLTIEKKYKNKTDYDIKYQYWFLLFLIPTGSIYITVVLFLSSYGSIWNMIAVVFLLGINVMVFILYDILGKYFAEINEKVLLTQQNIAYAHQFELLRESQESISILRHDMRNHIYSIKNMLENNKNKELLDYLGGTDEYIDIKSEYVRTGNVDVDSILNYKIQEAERSGAAIEIDVTIPDQLQIEAFDMNIIIGNLLDNAMEAIGKSMDKKIKILMKLDRGILHIKVENTYDGNLCCGNGKLITTKNNPNHHGIGLASIGNIIRKYDGTFDIDFTAAMFTVNVMLYNHKRKGN